MNPSTTLSHAWLPKTEPFAAPEVLRTEWPQLLALFLLDSKAHFLRLFSCLGTEMTPVDIGMMDHTMHIATQ